MIFTISMKWHYFIRIEENVSINGSWIKACPFFINESGVYKISEFLFEFKAKTADLLLFRERINTIMSTWHASFLSDNIRKRETFVQISNANFYVVNLTKNGTVTDKLVYIDGTKVWILCYFHQLLHILRW